MNYFRNILYICTLVALTVFAYRNIQLFQVLSDFSIEQISCLIFLACIPPFINSLRFREVIRLFGGNLVFKEWYGLTICNTFYNYIFPGQAGLILRAGYLKKIHNFPYVSYMGLVGVNYIINIGVAAAIAFLLTTHMIFLKKNQFQFIENVFLLSSLILVILFINLIILRKTNFVAALNYKKEFLKRIYNLVTTQGFNKRIFRIVVYQSLVILLVSIRLCYLFTFFNIYVEISYVILIQILINLTLIIAITPGNIGVSEGVMSFVMSVLGFEAEVVFAAMMVDRAITILFFSILGVIFSKKILLNRDGLNEK